MQDKYHKVLAAYADHIKTDTHAGKFYGCSSLGKLYLTDRDIYLVIVAWRPTRLSKHPLGTRNVILLNCKELTRLYSPSFVSRPQFFWKKAQDSFLENLADALPLEEFGRHPAVARFLIADLADYCDRHDIPVAQSRYRYRYCVAVWTSRHP